MKIFCFRRSLAIVFALAAGLSQAQEKIKTHKVTIDTLCRLAKEVCYVRENNETIKKATINTTTTASFSAKVSTGITSGTAVGCFTARETLSSKEVMRPGPEQVNGISCVIAN